MSFISEISPICKVGGYKVVDETLNRGDRRKAGAYIIHEAFATKDVGKEARGILNVRATFIADRLFPILVIYDT